MATFVFSVDGNSGPLHVGIGKNAMIAAWGDFGGGVVTVEYAVDGSAWIPDDAISWTDPNIAIIVLPAAVGIRFVLTGSTDPSVTVEARE